MYTVPAVSLAAAALRMHRMAGSTPVQHVLTARPPPPHTRTCSLHMHRMSRYVCPSPSCHGHGVGRHASYWGVHCVPWPPLAAPGAWDACGCGVWGLADWRMQAEVVATAEQSTTLSARITNADFTTNHADSIGGAAFIDTSNTTIGPGVTFTGNTAGDDTFNDDS